MPEYDFSTQAGKAKFVEDQNPVGQEMATLHVWMHEHPDDVTPWHIRRYATLRKQRLTLGNIWKNLFPKKTK